MIELDERLRPALEEVAARGGDAGQFGDAMKVDLEALDPAPTAMVSNLPYSIATPLLLRTIAELPSVTAGPVMVQREIADRLRAAPRTKAYGSPSVIVQLACRVDYLRAVDPAVFRPRPRVESALAAAGAGGAWPGDVVARLVRVRSHTSASRWRGRSASPAWRPASARGGA